MATRARSLVLRVALVALVLVSVALTLFSMDTIVPERAALGDLRSDETVAAFRRAVSEETEGRDLFEDRPKSQSVVPTAPVSTETETHRTRSPVAVVKATTAVPMPPPSHPPAPEATQPNDVHVKGSAHPAPDPTSADTTPSAVAKPTDTPLAPVSPTPTPTPSRTKDLVLSRIKLYPRGATTHNAPFITRSLAFDTTVSRDKGIIISLHNNVTAMGLSLIKELRCLGNHELIQVYHCLAKDLSREHQELLVRHDNRLEVIDVCSDLVHARVFTTADAASFVNWWVKPLAIHHTDLREPILLDADDILLHNPAIVRTTEGYQQRRAMFFYDRIIECDDYFRQRLVVRNDAHLLQHLVAHLDYAAFNLTGPHPSQHLLESFAYQDRTCHEMDSSLVAIDKTRAGAALDVLWWLITQFRHRVEFSWGDKEAFWLAYELAHVPYAFSPWGVSVVNSAPNKDLENHADTLCGSIAQYVPTKTDAPDVLYINGRALLDPLPQGLANTRAGAHLFYNGHVTHVTPRQIRMPIRPRSLSNGKLAAQFAPECLVGLGSTPLPPSFQKLLFRRRVHYLAASSNVLEPLAQCY